MDSSRYWIRTPISSISPADRFRIRVIAKVILNSGLQEWKSFSKNGEKIFFDLADDTGIIRVFGWNQNARKAAAVVQRDGFIELRDCFVDERNDDFNNTSHKYELKLGADTIIEPQPANIIQIIQEQVNFVPFPDVANFKKNQYFSVTGKISDAYPDPADEGFGPNGNEYQRQVIEITDDDENELKVMSWNGYIPCSDDLIGSTLTLIQCKYVPEWRNINSSGAQVFIDGERVDFT